jgi:aminoglycoside N3'-acetyltransferase
MNNLLQNLKKVGLKRGERILLYSNILNLPNIRFLNIKTLIDKILEIIGKKGDLVMPLYNFNTTEKDIFYLNKLPEKHNVGAMSKIFFTNYPVIRSKNPIHGHIGLGRFSNLLKKTDFHKSFGKDTDFDFFYKKKFKLLLLGAEGSEGLTYFHHLEYLYKIKYRKKIYLKRIMKDKKFFKKFDFEYFEKRFNYSINFKKILFYLEKKKTKNSFKKKKNIYFINIEWMHKVLSKLLNEKKYLMYE